MKKIASILFFLTVVALGGCAQNEEQKPTATIQNNGVKIESTVQGSPTAPPQVPKTPEPTIPAPPGPVAVTKEISMDSGNLFFKPNVLTLKLNQPVKIVFTNMGVHTFTIDELGVNVNLAGSNGEVSFTPKKTGTFQFYCAVAGHRQAGMWGTVTVQP